MNQYYCLAGEFKEYITFIQKCSGKYGKNMKMGDNGIKQNIHLTLQSKKFLWSTGNPKHCPQYMQYKNYCKHCPSIFASSWQAMLPFTFNGTMIIILHSNSSHHHYNPPYHHHLWLLKYHYPLRHLLKRIKNKNKGNKEKEEWNKITEGQLQETRKR